MGYTSETTITCVHCGFPFSSSEEECPICLSIKTALSAESAYLYKISLGLLSGRIFNPKAEEAFVQHMTKYNKCGFSARNSKVVDLSSITFVGSVVSFNFVYSKAPYEISMPGKIFRHLFISLIEDPAFQSLLAPHNHLFKLNSFLFIGGGGDPEDNSDILSNEEALLIINKLLLGTPRGKESAVQKIKDVIYEEHLVEYFSGK